MTDEIADLALGPRDTAIRFTGYVVNGVKYHTKCREVKRKTQNSGVMLKAMTCSYASARDMNPREGDVTYYGKVTEIVELYYTHNNRYVLFNCDWIDNNNGLISEDGFGFTLVNFKRLQYTTENASNEPFILASQAQQVFYVQDPNQEDWNIVLKMKPRDLYDDGILADIQVDGIGQQRLDEVYTSNHEDNIWVRDEVPSITIDDNYEL